MIIDVHTHFFPDFLAARALSAVVDATEGKMRICGDGTLSGLCGELSSCGIDYAVTLPVATRPDQVASINATLPLTTVPIIPFGALNPYDVHWRKELGSLVDRGVKGVKVHPEFQDFYIDDRRYTPFFEALAQSGLWVLTHAGYDPGPFSSNHATPERIAKLITRHPNLKLIAGHLGGLCQWDAVEEFLVGSNVYLDTAAIASLISLEQFERIVRTHGIDKILFGSDYPWESPEETITFICKMTFTELEKNLILGENAQALFGKGLPK